MLLNTTLEYIKKVNIACFFLFKIMPLVKRFIAFEKGQIVTLSSLSLNSRTVAKKTERSKAVLINFLNLNDNYGKGNF